MRIAVDHRLRLEIAPHTANLVMQLLLSPKTGPTQQVEAWEIACPGIESAASFLDAFGNRLHLVNQVRPEGAVEIAVRGTVDTRDTSGIVGRPADEPVPALFLRTTTLTRVPVTLYGRFRSSRSDTVSVLHGLMARVVEVLGERGATQSQSQAGQTQSQSGAAPADATLLAHAFVGAARALDIPARFVAGYCLDQTDAAHLHCWAEAFEPAMGWIGFDPLYQVCPTERHVRVSTGLDMLSTTPVRAVPAGDGARTVGLEVTGG